MGWEEGKRERDKGSIERTGGTGRESAGSMDEDNEQRTGKRIVLGLRAATIMDNWRCTLKNERAWACATRLSDSLRLPRVQAEGKGSTDKSKRYSRNRAKSGRAPYPPPPRGPYLRVGSPLYRTRPPPTPFRYSSTPPSSLFHPCRFPKSGARPFSL